MEEERAEPTRRRERFAAWTLERGLPIGLALLVVVQAASWLPHYLTWPLYADHDVFATVARSWDAGSLPYRDALCNNLPATIYVFFLLGKAFGWGNTVAFFGFDAALVLAFGTLLITWGRVRLGSWLAGLVGVAIFFAYYFDLTYALASQRDWHACAFALGGLMVLQLVHGRGRLYSSVALMAIALLFRPQAVVFIPTYLYAVSIAAGPRAVAGWCAALGLSVLVGISPLLIQGLLGDLLTSLRLTAPGSSYNRTTAASFAIELVKQANELRNIIVPVALLLMMPAAPGRKTLLRTWLLATAGAFAYKPMSPFPHVYLDHPLQVVLAIDAALVVALLFERTHLSNVVRLVAVLFVLAPSVSIKPRFCNPGGSVQALATLRRGVLPEAEPNGYRPTPGLPAAAYYPWEDYRSMLLWLDLNTRPATRVANMLKEVPAITGPTGRLSAFPAESIAWLKMVRAADEARFAEELDRASDVVVVWVPDEVGLNPNFQTPLLDEVVRRRFHLASRFGSIEVWTLDQNERGDH
jgi:hypothetical protein